MVHKFSEIVIKGPFLLVKGFLMGYISGSEKKFDYFFHRKSGIRKESLKDLVKEYFEFENYVHLCIENNVLTQFLSAIEHSYEKIGLTVESVKNIKSALFSFSYEVFNKKIAQEIKELFTIKNKEVKIVGYHPREQKSKNGEGVEAYAPMHAYVSKGEGKIEGNFYHVMQLYLSIKRSNASDFINCSDIYLQFDL